MSLVRVQSEEPNSRKADVTDVCFLHLYPLAISILWRSASSLSGITPLPAKNRRVNEAPPAY
ncbi:hypothetical protein EJE23_23800 [Enterobacter chengduensis]|nr:hypothetical protein FY206_16020 [Enterobacter chengduensis]RSK48711.1 hypothetical protein EJE23_23800 [Enterobacter chengduensis]